VLASTLIFGFHDVSHGMNVIPKKKFFGTGKGSCRECDDAVVITKNSGS
jgi:hypothetical protein